MSDRDAILAAISTPERAVRDISGLIGDRIAFGPVPAGPGGMATARAVGVVGKLRGRQIGGTGTEVHVPVQLDLTVDIGARAVPVEARMTVRIGLEACLAPDADHVVVEVDEIGPDDIALETKTSGIGGVLVRRLGNLDAEIRHHVIGYVTDLLASPEARDLRRIDLDEASDTA
ncbi:hypothetical protein GCM10023201_35570 [Actinomycetospora corticicola]|uniref:Uncharacterized protein n=1 Tax=Actinomycetospora corticicola TaxID=663602 RepID=A0A7Y9J8B8_9PSEU|nr:hypothetical protein [Actinomycetospora corticicola]NYD38946.1 hypothetical protein [Actinomycetospora corticicola]